VERTRGKAVRRGGTFEDASPPAASGGAISVSANGVTGSTVAGVREAGAVADASTTIG
jgi:hypothetical protein